MLVVANWTSPPISRPSGVLAAEDPDQTDTSPRTWDYKEFHLTALAGYRLHARVLFNDRYWFGREASLAPLDLMVGWRLMSNTDVLDRLAFYHQHRAWVWGARSDSPLPASGGEIVRHFANVHIIPSTRELERRLHAVRAGDVIVLRGYLVEATADDGWHWRSSLTRKDEGDTAAELMWVEGLAVEPEPE